MWLLSYTVMIACSIDTSLQHGFMSVPPQRSSLWREDFDSPINYNDNELYCGGRGTIQRLGGLCGVCGDPYEGPRENEAGGKYGNGIIGRRYEFGVPFIKTTVVLTAYHKGYFEYRLCPHNKLDVPVKQECLNRFLLPVAEEGGDLESADNLYRPPGPGIYNLTVFIPPGMRCSQCVIQWRYRTGNSWGVDPNGTACIGCGIQEEFRNCADISIGDDELGDIQIPDFIDHRFINKDESKNLPGKDIGDKFPVEQRIPEIISNPIETEKTDPVTQKVKDANSKIVSQNERVTDLGNGKAKNENKNIANVVNRTNKKEPRNPHQDKSATSKTKNTGKHSGISVNRSDVIGGVWSGKLEEPYSHKEEKNKLQTLILGLVKKYNQLKEARKVKKMYEFNPKQYIEKVDSNPLLRKLALQLRYLIARYHNRHVYTRLIPSSKKRNSSAVYRNRYNYIAKDSLEAQNMKRSWKFNPNPYFRGSRQFST